MGVKRKIKPDVPGYGVKNKCQNVLGGIKGWDQRLQIFLKKSEHYITSRNGWVSLKGIFRWYICRRDPSTYQNTPGPSGHTNV